MKFLLKPFISMTIGALLFTPLSVFADTIQVGQGVLLNGTVLYASLPFQTDWNTIRTSNGNQGNSVIRAGYTATGMVPPNPAPNRYMSMFRGILNFAFPTSTIPASSTINDVKLYLYEDMSSFTCTNITQAQESLRISDQFTSSDTVVTPSPDYENFIANTNVFSTDLFADNVVSSAYNEIQFNAAGRAYFQVLADTGSSTARLGLRLAADADNSAPVNETCLTYFQFQGTVNANPPYLVISYTPPGSGSSGVTVVHKLSTAVPVSLFGFMIIFLIWILRG